MQSEPYVERLTANCPRDSSGHLIVGPALVHCDLHRALFLAHSLTVIVLRWEAMHVDDDAILHVLKKLRDLQQWLMLSDIACAGRWQHGCVCRRRTYRRSALEDDDVAGLELRLLQRPSFGDQLKAHRGFEFHFFVDGKCLCVGQSFGAPQDREKIRQGVGSVGHVRPNEREPLAQRFIKLKEEEHLAASHHWPALVYLALGRRCILRRRARRLFAHHFKVKPKFRLELVVLLRGIVFPHIHHSSMIIVVELQGAIGAISMVLPLRPQPESLLRWLCAG
mmetsp:Transcript_31351/g.95870  ORF Transcript_31351/g.95870 Transcript_31351/m.95870 type:complete len:279 (+) Transcript_31351:1694-2530(+)